ncbi:MAG: class I SAM-dependent methyltransferase, partial [Bacteroidetes bacterium]|nr:class I SAM-dependent methyltransferase [Bacteroidota bacterium]
MSVESKYINEIYHFKGEWDVPSFCGLKVISKPDKTIVITTELYDSNPGT